MSSTIGFDTHMSSKLADMRQSKNLSRNISPQNILPFNSTSFGEFTQSRIGLTEVRTKFKQQEEDQMMIRQREKYLHNIKLYQPPNVIQHKFKNRNNKLKKILNTNKHMSIEVNDDDQQHIQMVIPVSTPQQDIELNKIINQVLINNRYNTKSTSSLLEKN